MATQTKPKPPVAGDGAPGARAWSEALESPHLADIPYKVETNARGQILLMSPPKTYHSNLQGDLILLLASDEYGPSGEGLPRPEYAVYTSDGVKVPDVVWISDDRAAQIPADAEASPMMPEICIEVLSRSNTQADRVARTIMEEKRHLFFEGGADEVWIVDADGHVTFYDEGGEIDASKRAPGFPSQVEG